MKEVEANYKDEDGKWQPLESIILPLNHAKETLVAIRLKQKRIEGFSLRAKELMEDSLESRGEFTLAVAYMPRATAQKIATVNNLSLDYKTIMWKGKPEEYYLFRVDYQQKLRAEQKERRKWGFIRNLTFASVLAFLIGLLAQIFISK